MKHTLLVSVLVYLMFLLFSSCTTKEANLSITPCHGEEMGIGHCPYAAVKDMDGTSCHHVINCGGL